MRVRDLFIIKDERIRMLHFTWIAFFISFVVWFNMAPLATSMLKTTGWLTMKHIKALFILNVALTIPGRVVIGAFLDRFGPRKCFSALLVLMSFVTFMFAFGDSWVTLALSRVILSLVGTGFVIGIRMTAEWFPPKHIGFAEGFYAGWGNFGSAAAAMLLPSIAFYLFGGAEGWRWAIASSGVICFLYGVFYFIVARDTPKGKAFVGAKKTQPMEVTSWSDLVLLILWSFPLIGTLGVLCWKLNKLSFIPDKFIMFFYVGLFLVLVAHIVKILQVNVPILRKGVPEEERYPFLTVTALNTTYIANFGAELAVVSMLPAFFEMTFSISPVMAGWIASSFAIVNLFARPAGGWFSDKLTNRKRVMLIYMIGISIGFALMGMINSAWPLALAIAVTVLCSFFVQGAEGATFAIIPLVKKRMTGQVAGMAGAYGNVGAVLYLTIYTFVTPSQFFFIMAGGAATSFLYCLLFLKEPKGAFAEAYDIDVSDSDSDSEFRKAV